MARLRILALGGVVAAVLATGAAGFGIRVEPLPAGVVGDPFAYQVQVHGGTPPYTFTVKSGELPPGLVLAADGALTGYPARAGTWRFYLEASYRFRTDPPRYSQRQFSLTVLPALVIRARPLAAATLGEGYDGRLTASGGGEPTWRVSRGALPRGMWMTRWGDLVGAPERTGTFRFTARASVDPRVAERDFALKVVALPRIASVALPPAVVGSRFAARLRAEDGLGPYTWAVKGARPPGISLVPGVLTGTPQVAGRYRFAVVLRDSLGNAARLRLAVDVQPRLALRSAALPHAREGRPYAARLVTAGGARPLRFTVVRGRLPRGVSLDGRTGSIHGTPRDRGRFPFTARVADRAGGRHERAFVLRVG